MSNHPPLTNELPLQVALLHSHEAQRVNLTKAIQSFGASVQYAAVWTELQEYPLGLGGVWVLFDESSTTPQTHRTTRDIVAQIRAAKQQAFWGVLILVFEVVKM